MDNEKELDFVITKIRKIRIEKNISQSELANRADFSQSFLANLESGKKKPSVMTLIRIANALGVSPRDFFPEANKKTKADIKKQIFDLVELL